MQFLIEALRRLVLMIFFVVVGTLGGALFASVAYYSASPIEGESATLMETIETAVALIVAFFGAVVGPYVGFRLFLDYLAENKWRTLAPESVQFD